MANQQPQIGFVMPNAATVTHGHNMPPYAGAQTAYLPNHQPFPQPIQIQPSYGQPGPTIQPAQWMTSNFQSYLLNASMFQVKQKVDLIETFLSWEVGNKYVIKDQSGNKVFYAGEQSDCLGRQCFDSFRPFTMSLKDNAGRDVICFERPLRCTQFCCCLCCPQEMIVSTPNGQRLGSVVEEWALFSQQFSIRDAAGNTVLKVTGPWIPCSFKCTNVNFVVRTLNDHKIGQIQKEFGGFVREMFTDADQFSVTFPVDLAPEIKAVVLGALFLIDYMFFEQKAG